MNHPITTHLACAANDTVPSTSWIARIENAFVRWQAARLKEIPAGKLWAQAMQDTYSLAELRRKTG